MKKNGTTTAGKTRWRCKNNQCGYSTTRHRHNQARIRDFRAFHHYATSTTPLATIAQQHHVSRWTLTRRFEPFWLIPIPTAVDPHRVYDQIFIDATYTCAGCLLVATSFDHVITWHWAKSETTAAYLQLLDNLAPPLCVVLDGGQGALSAIRRLWPTTRIQRCLVHAQRVVRRYTTTRPRTDAGKTIYTLAVKLTQVTTLDQARTWIIQLQEFGQIYARFLNEKTPIPPHKRRGRRTWEYTHPRVRQAYNSLIHLTRNNWLFTYLQPPSKALEPHRWTSTTNSLEGGINAPIKRLADAHRGRAGERQRKMIDWWLYNHTELPGDPLEIARQSHFGQDLLAKAKELAAEDINNQQETGSPALYDQAIPTEYTHSIGIRKGHIR